MKIVCKFCRYEYEYERYGEVCPQCDTHNPPFRSAGARQVMGTEELASRYFSHERRDEAVRAGDPMYGKSSLRRLRPYLMLLVLAAAVVMLGSSLMRVAEQATQPSPSVSSGEQARPPILELADAVYDLSFLPAEGMQLSVNAAGWIKHQPDSAEQWLFIDFLLLVTDRQQTADSVFLPPVAVAGEAVIKPESLPQADFAALYTPLDPSALEQDPGVSGQLFYRLPAGTKQLTLVYQQGETRQNLSLALPIQSENRKLA